MPDQKTFTSPTDILRLEIVDFRRLNGYWQNSGDALDRVYGLMSEGSAVYGVYDVPDFDLAPIRNDFPGWSHAGHHRNIGRRLWNWFHWRMPTYEFKLGDQPDFQAVTTIEKELTHFIWGDIGQVSASTFVFTLLHMRPGDLWMSLCDSGKRHVLIMFLGPESPDNGSRPSRLNSIADTLFSYCLQIGSRELAIEVRNNGFIYWDDYQERRRIRNPQEQYLEIEAFAGSTKARKRLSGEIDEFTVSFELSPELFARFREAARLFDSDQRTSAHEEELDKQLIPLFWSEVNPHLSPPLGGPGKA